jgi:hypothetical protein
MFVSVSHMSYRFEFVADASDGRIALPDDIAGRLRIKGITRLHVVVTSVAEEEERLASRGIDAESIDRVAAVQRFDRDVAGMVLGGEGGVPAVSDLAARLRSVLGAAPEAA